MAGRVRELNIKVGMDHTKADKQSDEFHAKQKQKLKELISDEDAALKARNQLTDQANQKKIQSTKKAMDTEKAGWLDIGGVQESALGSLKGYAAGFASLGAGVAILKSMVDYWDAIAKDSLNAVIKVSEYREKLVELAALREGTGKTTGTMIEQAQFRAKTLMTAAGAEAISKEAWAAAELSVDDPARGKKGTISREALQEALITAGKGQSMFGGAEGAWGELVGTIPLTSRGKTVTADQAKDFLGKSYDIQQKGGFTGMAEFAKQYKQEMSLAQAGVLSPEELSTLLSAMSTSGGATSGTAVEQIVRMSSADFIKQRGIKTDPSIEHTTSDKFMRQAGVREEQSPYERIKTIAKYVADKKKADPGLNVMDFLVKGGFQNEESRMGIIKMAGLMTGVEFGELEGVKNRAADPGRMDRQFNEAVRTDPRMQEKLARTTGEVGGIVRGMKTEGVRGLYREEFERLKQEKDQFGINKVAGEFEAYEDASKTMWGKYGPTSSYYGQVGQAVEQRLARAGARVGLADPRERMRQFGNVGSGGTLSEEQQAQWVQQIIDKGGDVTAEGKARLDTLQKRVGVVTPVIPNPMQGVPRRIEGRT